MNTYNVLKFQSPFEKLKSYDYPPKVCLYKAIITQAIIDASNNSLSKNFRKIELDAKNWIFGNSLYFQQVCHYADIDPSMVIKITKRAINMNIVKI